LFSRRTRRTRRHKGNKENKGKHDGAKNLPGAREVEDVLRQSTKLGQSL